MKIFAVGRNYADHAKEMNSPVPTEPVIFMKPAEALLKPGQPFTYPPFSKDIHYEAELVLRVGKRLPFDAISVGIDFTARDLQAKQKEKGLPWEIAKSFNGSAACGEFVVVKKLSQDNPLRFWMTKNGEICQAGDTSQMLFTFETILDYLKQFFTLEPGDLVFTGTPSGVGPVNIGDYYEGFLEGARVMDCLIG